MGAGDILDVLDPALVAAKGVGREAQQLDATLGELRLETSELAQLGRANRSIVLGVGEENKPLVANVLVQVDGTIGGLGLEVRGDGAQTKAVPSRQLPDRLAVDSVQSVVLECGDLRSSSLGLGHCASYDGYVYST